MMPRDTTGLLDAPIRNAEEIAIVDRMAERLVTKGWCQGHLQRGDERCFLGALFEATRNQSVDRIAYRIICAAHLIAGEAPHRWQDVPGRTVEDVLDLLAQVRRRFECFPGSRKDPGNG